MSRRALAQAHTGRELQAHFDHHPNLIEVRQCGSHRTYRGPNGSVVITCHNGDVARGTLRSICRMAALAGLAALALACPVGLGLL